MLKSLRLRLTLICVIVTGVLLSSMAVVLLGLSESQMSRQRDITFQNSINTIVYRIQSSRIIDDGWLSQMEAGSGLIIHIEDQGKPILFRGAWRPETDRGILIERARQTAVSRFGLDPAMRPGSVLETESAIFELQGDSQDRYQAAVVTVPSYDTWQSLTLLRDLKSDISRRWMMRSGSGAVIVLALGLLFLFSLWFSKKALLPVEAANQKQVEFIAAASHELKSPLAVVRACLSGLADGKTDRQQAARLAETADRECRRMGGLIDDLLLLASADTAGWSLSFQPVEPDTFLTELYDSFEPLAAKQDHRLSLRLPENLLPPMQADRTRLWQALSILLDNALTYTPSGGEIALQAEAKKKHLVLRVVDNGPGIPNPEKEKIFDRFYRLDAARTEKSHYGLGLSVAWEIVRRHDGSLSVCDTPGGGATFVLRLPLKDAEDQRAAL